eukprot:scaffold7520_cov140-Skeletonema_marinoi.AAC.7
MKPHPMNNNKLFTTSSMDNGGRHRQPLSESYSKEVEEDNINTNTMDAAPGATAPSGLDLLFTASQVETKPNEGVEAETEAERADVPFTIAVVTNGTGTAEAECESVSNNDEEEAPSSDDGAEQSTTGAIKVKEQGLEHFPQILQEILNMSDYQSIAHWLPDGLSFIIADKRRFADEIIPKHFRRVAIFHSFIRKLNRYGFRRIKGGGKGDESSFAHKDFVRDEPWLCLNMTCKSKPRYHKAPSAKKKIQHAAAADDDDEAANRLANDALIAPPAQLPPSFLAAGGMMMDARRVFVPTTYMPVTRTLPLPLPMARAAIGPLTERQFLASILPEHPQQYIFDERQILMLQMRQRHRLQVQLQRLHEMSALNEEQFLSYHHMVTQRRPRADSAAMDRAKGQEPITKRKRREDE